VSVDRRAINVLLAALDIQQRELAELTGYSPRYVANVLNGLTPVSKAFRGAFGQALADLLLGPEEPESRRYPAGPLVEVVRRRAEQAARKTDLYADLGVSPHTLATRELLSEELVDRVCCALGIHPTSLYGPDGQAESA
jgi:transcriptional regulator with XRE-family HTH domain